MLFLIVGKKTHCSRYSEKAHIAGKDQHDRKAAGSTHMEVNVVHCMEIAGILRFV